MFVIRKMGQINVHMAQNDMHPGRQLRHVRSVYKCILKQVHFSNIYLLTMIWFLLVTTVYLRYKQFLFNLG